MTRASRQVEACSVNPPTHYLHTTTGRLTKIPYRVYPVRIEMSGWKTDLRGMFWAHKNVQGMNWWNVIYGPTSAIIATGSTRQDAILQAVGVLHIRGEDEFIRRVKSTTKAWKKAEKESAPRRSQP